MSIRTKAASTVAAAIMALGGGIIAASPAQAARTVCPSGYACIYNGQDVASGIRDMWYQKGTYKIYDYYGKYLVVNHQTDNWVLWLCESSNGTGGTPVFPRNEGWVVDLTPINSVVIQPW